MTDELRIAGNRSEGISNSTGAIVNPRRIRRTKRHAARGSDSTSGHRGHSAGDGVFGQPSDGVDVELAHDALAMRFNRTHADAEAVGDLLIEQTLGDERKDFPFAVCQ